MHTLSMTFQSHMSIFSVELTLERLRTRPGIYMIGYGTEKKGLVVQISNRHFWMSQAAFWTKKIEEKNFTFFSLFIDSL